MPSRHPRPPRIKAVKKSRKHYLYDWTVVEDEGPRFENERQFLSKRVLVALAQTAHGVKRARATSPGAPINLAARPRPPLLEATQHNALW